MNYWLVINAEDLKQDLQKKANHIYIGNRHDYDPVLFPARNQKGRIENFGFWFHPNALRLLGQALTLGFHINRYAGSTSNQYYITNGNATDLGLSRNPLGQWVPSCN